MPVFQSKFGQAPAWCEDEYWIIFAGQGTVMTGGLHHPVGSGPAQVGARVNEVSL